MQKVRKSRKKVATTQVDEAEDDLISFRDPGPRAGPGGLGSVSLVFMYKVNRQDKTRGFFSNPPWGDI